MSRYYPALLLTLALLLSVGITTNAKAATFTQSQTSAIAELLTAFNVPAATVLNIRTLLTSADTQVSSYVACDAPAGLSCLPGSNIVAPVSPGNGYTPGFGGGGPAPAVVATTGDKTPPVISSIATSSVGSASATITWTTDESADSEVDFGTTASYGTASSSAATSISHTVTLTGLASNTVYHFRIQSSDASGNAATSADQLFTTGLPSYTSIAGIGDSVTVGVNASDSAHRWLNLTEANVGASVLLNAGISGTVLQNSNGSGGVPLSSNGRDRYASAVLGSNKKDALFFAYGFNDARYTAAPTTFNVANYLNDMREVMNGLMLGGYAPQDIYILSPYYITDTGLASGSAGFTGQTRTGFEAYVSAAQTIATEFGTKFTNTYTYERDNGGASLIDTDNIHPIDAGHQVIADAIKNTTTVLNVHTQLTGLGGSASNHTVSVFADPATGVGTVTGYEFELVNDDDSNAVVVATTTSATPSVSIPDVLNGTYRVFARADYSDSTQGPWAFSSGSVTVFAFESTPPVISAIAVSTTTSTALITWTTDESADSEVDFGADSTYGTASSSTATSTSHSITLTGLIAGDTYHYRVQSTDVWGNVATSSDLTFTTQSVDTTFVKDTFTDTTGTTLATHTPDTGDSWAVQTGSSPTTAPTIGSGGDLYSLDNASIYNIATTTTSADYYVQADFVYHSTLANDNVGIAGRMSTSANTYYVGRWSQAQGAWQILRVVSGSSATLGSFVDTFTSGTRQVRLTMTGSALTLAIDGVTRISVSSTAITAAGRPGIRMAIIQSATTGIHLDNFSAGY